MVVVRYDVTVSISVVSWLRGAHTTVQKLHTADIMVILNR